MIQNVFLVVMASVIINGCSKPTEEQRLEKFRSSLKYKTYHFASEKTVGITVAEYNKRTSPAINASLVHSTLGIIWFLSERSEYSLAEADIAASAAAEELRILALGLQSIALSKMKYPRLASSCYDELKALLAARQGIDASQVEVEHKVMLLSLIAVSLHHGEPDLAKFGADALGAISELDYLPPLVGAVVEARKGSPLKAVAQLRELSKNERFSEHKKAIMAEIADIMANSPSDRIEQDLTNRVLVQLVKRVLDDVFSEEDKRFLLEKAKELPEMITGETDAQPSLDVDDAVPAKPEE